MNRSPSLLQRVVLSDGTVLFDTDCSALTRIHGLVDRGSTGNDIRSLFRRIVSFQALSGDCLSFTFR